MTSLKTLLYLSLFFSVTAISPMSFADDGAFEGEGANVYPITNNHIQMVSETIDITYDSKNFPNWNVDVSINFINHGPAAKIQMGFPFKEPYSPDGDNDETYSPDGDDDETDDPPYSFTAFVNGKRVKTTTKNGTLNPDLSADYDFEKVMTFPVQFNSGEKKVIRHTYSIGGASYSTGEAYLRYILRTGGLWKGVIEDCKIRLKAPPTILGQFQMISPKEHQAKLTGNVLQLSWDFKNIKPDFDIVLRRFPTTLGDTTPDPSSADVLKGFKSNASVLLPEYIRYYRNKLIAGYGYNFSNPLVKAQFANVPAQNGKVKYDISRMSKDDKELLLFLEFIDREMVVRKSSEKETQREAE